MSRWFLSLVLLGLVMTTGRGHAAAQDATPPADSADPTVAIMFLETAFNEGAAVDSLVTPDVVLTLARDRYEGAAAIEQLAATLRRAFPDLQLEVETAFGQADMVAIRFTLTGTQAGPFPGLPNTGRAISGVPGHALVRVHTQRIAEAWVLVDTDNLTAQLIDVTPPQSASGPASPPPDAPPEAGIVALVERYYAAYAAGDEATLQQVIAEAWVGHPDGAAREPGRAGFLQNYAAWRAVFPDTHHEIVTIVASGDLVAVHTIVRGTQQGAFGYLAPTGRAVAFALIDVWRVERGQLVELWSVGDYAGLVAQLLAEATPMAA
jgi:predicted ester cyclase